MAKRCKYGKAAKDDYDWYEVLNRYKNYKDTHGRNPRSSGGDKDEEQLYYWMYNQTRLIKTGHMSQEHIQALLDAGVDIPNKGNLNDTYVRNVRSVVQKTPSKGNLYTWMIIQHREYESGTLLDWRIQIWKENDAMELLETFGKANQKWIERLSVYAELLKGQAESSDRKEAVIWFNRQVVKSQKDALPAWKLKMLKESGLELKKIAIPGNHRDRWLKRYEQYAGFCAGNGRRPSQTSTEEKALYSWGRTQIKLMRKGELSAERRNLCRNIGLVA